MSKEMQLKDRIKSLAQKNRVSAQAVLQNFMLERLLERISLSKYKEKLILKGGMLIASMVGINNRTTMDMDATLQGYPLSEETVREAFLKICAVHLDDQVTLSLEHIVPIRGDDEYGGYRVALLARFESIGTPLKVDITTGDIITPHPIRYIFHSNFETKRMEVWPYNIETILAEKLETILSRSVLNTRPRDYYDVYIIMKTRRRKINKRLFMAALNATAQKRGSVSALHDNQNILRTIKSDPIMSQRWERYCKENNYATGIKFAEVIEVLLDVLTSVKS
jgi:predicted nucleotidyltransferase component of viral defense system